MAIYEVVSAVGLKVHNDMMAVSLLLPIALTVLSYIGEEYIIPVIFLFIALLLIMMLFNHEKYSFSLIQ